MKITTLLAFVFTFHLAFVPKAQAHGGEYLIFLPVILTYNATDTAWVSSRIMHKGFKIDATDAILGGVVTGLIDKREERRYSFRTASTIEEAKEACEKHGFTIATPEEVARLYSIRHVDRFQHMITTDAESDSVMGFYEGEANYFKLNMKTQELEVYDRSSDAGLAPVICVSNL